MDSKTAKNSCICAIGAIGLMSLVYFFLFNVTNINIHPNLSWNGFLDSIENLKWRYINFSLGSTILCCECMSYKNTKDNGDKKNSNLNTLYTVAISILSLTIRIVCNIILY